MDLGLLLLWLFAVPTTSAWVPKSYEILEETSLYNGRWRSMINRRVQMLQNVVDFAVVRNCGTDQAVLVFAWDTKNKTATLIREYMPSAACFKVGLPAGNVETEKHQSVDGSEDLQLVAAKYELEEECRLQGGKQWFQLARDVVMDKYTTTKLSVYLVLDAEVVSAEDAKPRDSAEEGMEVLENVNVATICDWIAQGEMTVVGSWASLLALGKLRELGEIA